MRTTFWAWLTVGLLSACAPCSAPGWARASSSAPPPLVASASAQPRAEPAPPRSATPPTSRRELASPEELLRAFRYIEAGWSSLERNHRQLLAIARDPKFPPVGKWPVYIPEGDDRRGVERALAAQVPAADLAQVEFLSLPAPKKLPIPAPAKPGLLYLPHPYVVPGGRFNEMYGWDSYFILLGLLRDGKLERARGMVDNFIYEIEHYGTILNANRSYYLSRSQPPLLTPMILAVHAKLGDPAWLQSVSVGIDRYYAYFVSEPHLVPPTGLSRYYDLGKGPAIEVLAGEKDERGRSHYDRVKAWFEVHPVADYDVGRFYQRSRNALTDLFYIADRSMRESGFDPSHRFGPFNSGVIDYNPVCLNSLLYRMEKDAALIQQTLGNAKAATRWTERAAARARAIHRYLWDPAEGLFLDYDFRRGVRRNYPFGTVFFPLWAGLASPEQAATLVPKALGLLESPGGLRTSAHPSGNQWDAPFGWAPLQWIAVEGLRRYGYPEEADRVSLNFLSLVLKEFREHQAIFEKYDVERRQSDVADGIRFGYSSNEIGFGWTNAAFVTLFDALPEARRAEVRRLGGVPIPSRR